MEQRDIKITQNMLALAKRRKGKNKRSIMLRTIMPHLSQTTGEQLADAIDANDSNKFASAWNKVRAEIQAKLDKQRHHAHASAKTPTLFEEIYGDIVRRFSESLKGTQLRVPETDFIVTEEESDIRKETSLCKSKKGNSPGYEHATDVPEQEGK